MALQTHRCVLQGAQPYCCINGSLWKHLSDQALGQNISLLGFLIPGGISWEQGCLDYNTPGSHMSQIGGNWKASKFIRKALSKPRCLQFQASVEQDTWGIAVLALAEFRCLNPPFFAKFWVQPMTFWNRAYKRYEGRRIQLLLSKTPFLLPHSPKRQTQKRKKRSPC